MLKLKEGNLQAPLHYTADLFSRFFRSVFFCHWGFDKNAGRGNFAQSLIVQHL